MKKSKKNVLNNKKGITLIALVVTIIALLILAGISITMLTGENGILVRTTDAKIKNEWGYLQEEVAMAYADAVGDLYLDTNPDKNVLYQKTIDKLQSGKYTVTVVAGNLVGAEEIYSLKKGNEDISSLSLTKIGAENATETIILCKKITGGAIPYYVMTNDGRYYEILNKGNGEVELAKGETQESDIIGEATYRVEIESNDPDNLEANYDETTGSIIVTGKGKTIEKKITVKKINIIDGIATEVANCTVTVFEPLTENEMANAKGEFVYYNVPYKSCGSSTYSYTSNNGWRVLNIKEDENGTYDLEIISTGIPATINYHYYFTNPTDSSYSTYSWWGDLNDSKKLSGVNSYFATSFTSWNYNVSAYFAAYGFKYNFNKITFEYKSNGISHTNNVGAYKSINGYSSGKNIVPNTNLDIITAFKEKTNKNGGISTLASKVTGIREVEYSDIGNRSGTAPSNVPNITAVEDKNATGLFQLSNINSNTAYGLTKFNVNDLTDYWLANPNGSNGQQLWYVNSNGAILGERGTSRVCGIRPVIALSGVRIIYDNTSQIYFIE